MDYFLLVFLSSPVYKCLQPLPDVKYVGAFSILCKGYAGSLINNISERDVF